MKEKQIEINHFNTVVKKRAGSKKAPPFLVNDTEWRSGLMKLKTIIKVLSKLGSIFMFMLILSGTSLACRMYGVISNDLPDGLLQDHLIDEPNSLKALSYVQVDGWGIAYYPDYGDPATLRKRCHQGLHMILIMMTVVGNINLIRAEDHRSPHQDLCDRLLRSRG